MTYTSVLIALTPMLVAMLRRDDWPSGRVASVAVLLALIAYIGGRYLDGVQPSLQLGYIQGFVAAVLGQQTLYQLIKGTDWMQWLEAVGEQSVPRSMPGDQQ